MQVHPPEGDGSSGACAGFDYSAAFSRNIGWITEWEQQELRNKTVAIAGLGGVGGAHALTLARLGVGGFHLADLDRFDVVNLNRQAGAFISTVNLEKTAVMAHMTRDINPELRQEIFTDGVNDANLDAFLAGVDLFVDGLDFFVIDMRRKVFKRCAELGIPAITAGPIGFGAAYLIFMPGGMSFEEYFRFEGLSKERQYVNFAVGLTPKGFHRGYMVDPSRVDLAGKRGPSTAAAIQLCSGIVGAEAVKILLGRGKVHAAPAYHQFDAFRGKWHRGHLRNGNAGPLQSLKRRIGYKAFGHLSRNARPAEAPATGSELERILDVARWAPSGDNNQPWRFDILGEDRVAIHVTAKEDDVYEYNKGQPTLLAAGMLLETIRIAASRFGRAMEWSYEGGQNGAHLISVALPRRDGILEDALITYIPIRSVDRRSYRTKSLSAAQKDILSRTLGDEFSMHWYESLGERLGIARLSALATDIRLRLHEAYVVHRRIIDWDRPFSPDGVPAKAVGLDPLTLRFMRWAMDRWDRMNRMNSLPGGTRIAQLQLDLLPGIKCAGHFVIHRRDAAMQGGEQAALLRAGAAIQRFWLTATRLGLVLQPALAPLRFGPYAPEGAAFAASPKIERKIAKLTEQAAERLPDKGRVLFLGRIGHPAGERSPTARSIRKALGNLLVTNKESPHS